MKIFLISPVAKTSPVIEAEIQNYIQKQKKSGNSIYYPLVDTNQKANEFEICHQNLNAIIDADEVHIYFQEESGGSKFDLGMAFALKKKIILVNHLEKNPRKSFGNLLLYLKNMN